VWRKRRSERKAANFRYFFATDIHGSDRCFRKFLAGAPAYRANALILGGDIAGKAIVPIEDLGGNRYRYTASGAGTTVIDADELPAAIGNIGFHGFYPHVCEPAEYRRLAEDEDARHSLFAELIAEQVRGWIELAEERLDPEVRCIITPGNDDPVAIDPVLGGSERVECPERSLLPVGPALLASLGNTNHTPWKTEREYEEDQLAEQIDTMLAARGDGEPTIFNFHCPPYDSGLDTVMKITDDFRPVMSGGAPVEVPVGSTAVRDAIKRYKPAVGLHGHIHECKAVAKIGETVCINPGSVYNSGWLQGVIVDLDEDGRYVSHVLTSG
jgi:uncharacterized protein